VARDRGGSGAVGVLVNEGKVAATPVVGAGTADSDAAGVEFVSASAAAWVSAFDSSAGAAPLVRVFVEVLSAGAEAFSSGALTTDGVPPRRRTRCSAIGVVEVLTASCRIADTSVSDSGACSAAGSCSVAACVRGGLRSWG
jgi:hypothetical protein